MAAGESLGFHGERQHAWFGVLEGLIKWSITARDGRTVTLGGQSVGSWFGEGTLIRDMPRKSDLVALRHSRVAQIPFETFDWLRRTQPSFNEFLLIQVNERLHWFMGNVAARGLLDTDAQVARAIVGMVHPLPNPRGERYLQISQEELANLAAVSRQSCNNALTHLKEQGTGAKRVRRHRRARSCRPAEAGAVGVRGAARPSGQPSFQLSARSTAAFRCGRNHACPWHPAIQGDTA